MIIKYLLSAILMAANISSAPPEPTSNKNQNMTLTLVCESYSLTGYYAEYSTENNEPVSLAIQYGTITSGTYNSGGNWYSWTNALVSVSSAFFTMHYRADFHGSQYDAGILSVSSGYAFIGDAVFPHTLSIPIPYVTSGAARAVMSVQIGQITYQLILNVPAGSFNPSAYVQY